MHTHWGEANSPTGHLWLEEADGSSWGSSGPAFRVEVGRQGLPALQGGGQRFEWEFRGATSQQPHAGDSLTDPICKKERNTSYLPQVQLFRGMCPRVPWKPPTGGDPRIEHMGSSLFSGHLFLDLSPLDYNFIFLMIKVPHTF